MQPKANGPIGKLPKSGSSVVKPEPAALKVQVDIRELDLFKAVSTAMVMLYEKADSDTQAAAIEILKDHEVDAEVLAGLEARMKRSEKRPETL